MDIAPGRVYFRKDLPGVPFDGQSSDPLPGQWHMPTVGTLRTLLQNSEMPDDWELVPNRYGNLAVYRWREHGNEGEPMRYYIGYVDLHTGMVHLNPDAMPTTNPALDRGDRPPGWPGQAATTGVVEALFLNGTEDQSVIHEAWEHKGTGEA